MNLRDIAEREVVPGYRGRFVHSPNMTVAHWNITAGYPLPQHTHLHEQVVNVIEGNLEITVGGETRVLEPGNIVVIPPHVPHSGRALTDCRVIDVFYPVREDYR